MLFVVSGMTMHPKEKKCHNYATLKICILFYLAETNTLLTCGVLDEFAKLKNNKVNEVNSITSITGIPINLKSLIQSSLCRLVTCQD